MSSKPTKNAASAAHDQLRFAFGQFATGVCIVSAPAPSLSGHAFAITVNSFATVSLKPPMISWCVQKDSTSYPLWMASQTFAVSVLNQSQGALCHYFAIRGNHPIQDESAFRESGQGNPVVIDALATFDCRVNAIHDAGDHSLILADVIDYQTDDSQGPLVYHRGAIRA